MPGATRPDLRVRVIDCDHGIGVVERGEAEDTIDLTMEQVASMTFAESDAHRVEWLKLTSPQQFDAVVIPES